MKTKYVMNRGTGPIRIKIQLRLNIGMLSGYLGNSAPFLCYGWFRVSQEIIGGRETSMKSAPTTGKVREAFAGGEG